MHAQCDEEGKQFNLMESNVDHKNDGPAAESVGVYIKHRSNKQFRNTTKRWHLRVKL
jgi:hypothetical protein